MKTPKRCNARVALLEAEYRNEDAADMSALPSATTEGTPLFARREETPAALPAPSPTPEPAKTAAIHLIRQETVASDDARQSLRIAVYRHGVAQITLADSYGTGTVVVTHDEMRTLFVQLTREHGAEVKYKTGMRVLFLSDDPDEDCSDVLVRVSPPGPQRFTGERVGTFSGDRFDRMAEKMLAAIDSLQERCAA